MFQIIYSSEAATRFWPVQLVSLLELARCRNDRHNVTGMLVYCNGHFLQALEGDSADVIRTYERIEKDIRHTRLKALFRGHSPVGRVFGEWSMGFQDVSNSIDLPSSFVRVSDRIDLLQFDHALAIEFLAACRQKMDTRLPVG